MQPVIRSRTAVSQDIVALELGAPDGRELPSFDAGGHIDLHLANGLVRGDSLVNDPAERHRVVESVQKDAASRGGSRFVHEALQVGLAPDVGGQRNQSRLVEDAPRAVLTARGIGITPMYCMVLRMEAPGRPWTLYSGARSHSRCAFLDERLALERGAPGRVHIHIDDEHGGQVMDMVTTVASVPADAHRCCCGAAPMLKAFEAAMTGRPEDQVHVEYFSAAVEAASAGGIEIVLARTKRTVRVEKARSILDTLLGAGVDVRHCCKKGVCGACQTTVLEGQPDHRDAYLSPAERRSGKTMMLRCSRSASPSPVLDP